MGTLRGCISKLAKNLPSDTEQIIRARMSQFGGSELKAVQDRVEELEFNHAALINTIRQQSGLDELDAADIVAYRRVYEAKQSIEPGATSEGPLGGISAGEVSDVAGQGDAGTGVTEGGETDQRGTDLSGRPGNDAARSEGSGVSDVSVSDSGAGGRGRVESSTGRDVRGPEGNVESTRDDGRYVTGSNYVITEADALGAGGAKGKYHGNVAAIRLLKTIQAEGRLASREEQAVLVKYVGWGGLPQAFDETNEKWSKENAELKELLSAEEYDSARSSTQNAHYTSPEIINGIYEGLKRLGFSGGRVLEPSAGTGHFIGLMPGNIGKRSTVSAIELDPLTGDIAALLYPESSVHSGKGYQEVEIPDEYFDVVVGNPPFGQEHIYDPKHKTLKNFSIHNYFFAKSMEKLRPGGVLAMVVSNYMMDGRKTAAQRRYIASQGKLLGAVRLPNNAFKQNAGTEVTTDIIFLQKRDSAYTDKIRAAESSKKKLTKADWQEIGRGERWSQVKTIKINDKDVPLNEYFVAHPEMMLGEMTLEGSMYAADTPALVGPPGQDIGAELSKAVQNLEKGVYKSGVHTIEEVAKATAEMPEDAKTYSYFVTENGFIGQRLPDLIGERQSMIRGLSEGDQKKAAAILGVKDTLNNLMRAEQSDASTETLKTLRTQLNTEYDALFKEYGAIHGESLRHIIRDDPDFPRLLALENDYKPKITDSKKNREAGLKPGPATLVKADIFSRRVLQPPTRVEKADSAEDAMLVSLNETGGVDIDRIAELRGKSVEDVVKELGDLVYNENGNYVSAEEYLSGNVKKKLAEARLAGDPRNIEALEAVQPVDKEPLEISAVLGAPWIPSEDIEAFITDLIGGKADVTYAAGKWIVSIHGAQAVKNNETWGTPEMSASDLIPKILGGKSIVVRTRLSDGSSIVNTEATLAANTKANEIKREFIDNETGDGWLWRDADRRERLARIFNDKYNTHVGREYDGSYLTLPGLAEGKMLRPHGKRAVARGIQGSTLFDHAVGSGKTWVGASLAMELRRLNLAKKPMIVVPNHLVGQWANEFYAIFPDAKVLMTTKRDFQKENRKVLMSRIATGDWDAVVISHSQFTMVPVPKEVQEATIKEELAEIEAAAKAAKNSGESKRTVKQIEKMKDKRREKLKSLADKKEDDTINFAELGVDALIVDEAHEYKNLFFTSSKQGIAGIASGQGSKKATDMFNKMRMVQKANKGKNTFFLTGTPISNSMAEMFTMQRYLQMDELQEKGLHHFDAWADVFAEATTAFELDTSGSNYKMKTRFRSFNNMSQLQTMYRSFADVMLSDDLKKQGEAMGEKWPVPKIKTVSPEQRLVERTPEQAEYMSEIIHRMENMPSDATIDNPLKATNDARKMALDMRLIDPDIADTSDSKASVVAEDTYRLYKKWDADKGTILIFIDLSTPKTFQAAESKRIKDLIRKSEGENGKDKDKAIEALSKLSMDDIQAANAKFDVYNDIKSKLIDMGIPAEEIVFAHEGTTDAKLATLHDKVRSGAIRVFMGSTQKMGTGMNVQKRLVGLINVDAPWRPSDIEQRIGRIVRQGNDLYNRDPENFEIEVINMATKSTYDARMWELLQQKAQIIEQVRSGVAPDSIEDVSSSAATFADMKAAATDNPLIMRQVQLTQELKELEMAAKSYTSKQHRLDSLVRNADRIESMHKDSIEELNNEIAFREENANNPWAVTVGSNTYQQAVVPEKTDNESKDDKKKRVAVTKKNAEAKKQGLAALQLAFTKSATNLEDGIIGVYKGRDISLENFKNRQVIQWGDFRSSYYSDDTFSAQGLISKIENYLSTREDYVGGYERKIESNKIDVEEAKIQLEQPFERQEELDSVRRELGEVMDELERMKDPQYVPQHKRVEGETYNDKGYLVDPNANPDGDNINGVFSLNDEGGNVTNYTRAEALSVLGEITSPVPVNVISAAEIPARVGRMLPEGSYVGGYVENNEITIVYDHMKNNHEMRLVLAHEITGHIGVNNVVEDWESLTSEYQGMKQRGGKTFEDVHAEVVRRYGDITGTREVSEFIAVAAERRYSKGVVGRFMDKVKDLINSGLNAMGFTQPFGMTDINRILEKAEKSISSDSNIPWAPKSFGDEVQLSVDNKMGVKRSFKVKDTANQLSDKLRENGFVVDISHSSTHVGKSSYLRVSTARAGNMYLNIPEIRVSDHSGGTNRYFDYWHVSSNEDAEKIYNKIIKGRQEFLEKFAPEQTDLQFSVIEKVERDQAIAKGLPMDKTSRYERAREQGFDTSKTWYRGQTVAQSIDAHRGTTFYGSEPEIANNFALKHGNWVTPNIVEYNDRTGVLREYYDSDPDSEFYRYTEDTKIKTVSREDLSGEVGEAYASSLISQADALATAIEGKYQISGPNDRGRYSLTVLGMGENDGSSYVDENDAKDRIDYLERRKMPKVFIKGEPTWIARNLDPSESVSPDMAPNVTPVFIVTDNIFDFRLKEHVSQIDFSDGFASSQGKSWPILMRDGQKISGEKKPQAIKSGLEKGSWTIIESDLISEQIKELGFDGFYVKEGVSLLSSASDDLNIGMFDTSAVRSVNAAFDPGFIGDSSSIMFSILDQKIEDEPVQPRIADTPTPEGPVRFTDPDTESRFQEAKKGLADQRTIKEKVSDSVNHTIAGFSRRHINLPNKPQFALANEALRQYEAAPQAAKEESIRALQRIVGHLSKDEYDLFTRSVILSDLAYEAELGHDLPFGFTPESLAADKAEVDMAVDLNANILKSLKYREALNETVKEQLVDAGILSEESAKNPAYFRHQVLVYARARNLSQGTSALKKPKPGYAKHRQGSQEDINANYLEAEFEYLHRALIDIKATDTINKIGKDYNIAKDLRAQAKAKSKETGEDVDFRDLVPEGYTLWQPDKGNVFFTGLSMPERAMNKLMDETHLADMLGKSVELDALRDVISQIKKSVMMGGKKMEMVIPEEIAATLDDMRPDIDNGLFDHIFKTPLKYWKQWTLISPRRVLRYNLNNISGDMDAVLAGNPQAVKKLPQAIRELYDVMKGGDPSKRYTEAVERGVFDAGLSVQEIPDINLLDPFAHIIDRPGIDQPGKFTAGKLYSVWKVLRDYTRFRENWLRYAAYLDYAERLEGGESIESIGYGASSPAMVDEVLADDINDAAALLARDLVGDYGDVSHFGQGIRAYAIPFYSWMEVNTRRYVRLIDNAFSQGVGKGFKAAGILGAGAGARTTAYLGVRMALMYVMVQLWNNLMFPDDEEALTGTDRARLHINLGRDADGQVRTLRFQGALSDFLQWFGFNEAVGAMIEIEKGRADWKDVANAIGLDPHEPLKPMVNKIASGLSPIKIVAELATGQSTWPDVYNSRMIRDKYRHTARLFGMENEYDVLAGKPSRGYINSLSQTLVYKRDPGEMAYNKMRGMAIEWNKEKKGMSGSSSFSTERSQATYEWRQAKRFGDTDAARKALKKLGDLGMKNKDINDVKNNAHPLASIAKKDRREFMDTLTKGERESMNNAIAWYQSVYWEPDQPGSP